MGDLVLLEREDWTKTWKEKDRNLEDFDLTPLRKGHASKVRHVDVENRSFEIVISSEAVDRDGDVITMKGWSLKDFRKNPVVQWAHSHSMPAIARSTKTGREDDVLVGTPKFPTEGTHPFADMIFDLYTQNIINASSVGFLPKEFEPLDPEDNSFFAPVRFLKQELLEFSLVNVPSNPEALGRAKSLGINIAPLREWAIQVLDGDGEEGGMWLPKSKVLRALQIVENDRTAVPMDGYKLIPASDGKEAIVVIEVPVPADLEISATELDKRLSHGVIEETVANVTNDLMAEAEEDVVSAVADEAGKIHSIRLSRIQCEHCEIGFHDDLIAQLLHKDKEDFFTLCPETNKPIIASLTTLLGTNVVVSAEVDDEEEEEEEEEESGNKGIETEDKGDDDVTFETADGEQLLGAILGDSEEKVVPPDDFVKGVGNIIKDAIGRSTKEAVREHLTTVTGKLD